MKRNAVVRLAVAVSMVLGIAACSQAWCPESAKSLLMQGDSTTCSWHKGGRIMCSVWKEGVKHDTTGVGEG